MGYEPISSSFTGRGFAIKLQPPLLCGATIDPSAYELGYVAEYGVQIVKDRRVPIHFVYSRFASDLFRFILHKTLTYTLYVTKKTLFHGIKFNFLPFTCLCPVLSRQCTQEGLSPTVHGLVLPALLSPSLHSCYASHLLHCPQPKASSTPRFPLPPCGAGAVKCPLIYVGGCRSFLCGRTAGYPPVSVL